MVNISINEACDEQNIQKKIKENHLKKSQK
jgi:hypothetical protein